MADKVFCPECKQDVDTSVMEGDLVFAAHRVRRRLCPLSGEDVSLPESKRAKRDHDKKTAATRRDRERTKKAADRERRTEEAAALRKKREAEQASRRRLRRLKGRQRVIEREAASKVYKPCPSCGRTDVRWRDGVLVDHSTEPDSTEPCGGVGAKLAEVAS